MPKHKTKNVLVEVVRHVQTDKQKKKKKRRRRKGRGGNGGCPMVGRIAAMLADPCGAHIQGGSYGAIEGSFARVHDSSATTSDVATPGGTGVASAGYVLWCPDYSPEKTDFVGNCFGFCNSDSNLYQENNTTVPFGSAFGTNFWEGRNMVTAARLVDPGAALGATKLVQDTRCLSACIRMTPTGKLMDVSGSVAIIDGITQDELLNNFGTSYNSLNVDSLFNYASDVRAFTRDATEARWRPAGNASVFRTTNQGACLVGTPGTSATLTTDSAASLQPRYFGIAWRGVDVSVGHPFTIDFVKNMEFRLAPIANMAHSKPEQVSRVPLAPLGLEVLDEKIPDWQSAHKESFGDTISQIALGASTVGTYVAKNAPGFLRSAVGLADNLLGYAEMAPLAALL